MRGALLHEASSPTTIFALDSSRSLRCEAEGIGVSAQRLSMRDAALWAERRSRERRRCVAVTPSALFPLRPARLGGGGLRCASLRVSTRPCPAACSVLCAAAVITTSCGLAPAAAAAAEDFDGSIAVMWCCSDRSGRCGVVRAPVLMCCASQRDAGALAGLPTNGSCCNCKSFLCRPLCSGPSSRPPGFQTSESRRSSAEDLGCGRHRRARRRICAGSRATPNT